MQVSLERERRNSGTVIRNRWRVWETLRTPAHGILGFGPHDGGAAKISFVAVFGVVKPAPPKATRVSDTIRLLAEFGSERKWMLTR